MKIIDFGTARKVPGNKLMSKRIGTVSFLLFIIKITRFIIWLQKFGIKDIMKNVIFDQQGLLCIHSCVATHLLME